MHAESFNRNDAGESHHSFAEGAQNLSREIWSSLKDATNNILGRDSNDAKNGNSEESGVVARGPEMHLSDGQKALPELALNDSPKFDPDKPIPPEARKPLIADALRKAGEPVTRENIAAVNLIVQKESGWDADVVNGWDSNAKKGTPSKGLMQVIDPTFKRYSLPGHKDITEPDDNMIAGIRYAVDRYGSLQNVPGVKAVNRGRDYRGY